MIPNFLFIVQNELAKNKKILQKPNALSKLIYYKKQNYKFDKCKRG